MALMRKKYLMGWYGKCDGCVDLDLASASFRYSIHSIIKVDSSTGETLKKWIPETIGVENDFGGGKGYDEKHNSEFTKLECGSVYIIINPDKNEVTIPNFTSWGGSPTYECECE